MKKKNKPLWNYAKYTSIASQMIIIIVVGTFGGLKLDSYLNLKMPIFTITLSLSAVVFAIYLSIKDFLKK